QVIAVPRESAGVSEASHRCARLAGEKNRRGARRRFARLESGARRGLAIASLGSRAVRGEGVAIAALGSRDWRETIVTTAGCRRLTSRGRGRGRRGRRAGT